MAYASTAELRTYLGLADNADNNTLVNAIIANGTELINIDLWDSLEPATKTRRISGLDTKRLVMENTVNAVNSVQYKYGESFNDLTVDYIDGNIVYLTTKAPRGDKNIKIEYTRGYASIPVDFKNFFLLYCKNLYDMNTTKSASNQSGKEIKSKTLETLSITYFSPSEMASNSPNSKLAVDYDKVINKYKNFSINRV